MGFQKIAWDLNGDLHSGERSHKSGKPQFFMDGSTISMLIFSSELLVYQKV